MKRNLLATCIRLAITNPPARVFAWWEQVDGIHWQGIA